MHVLYIENICMLSNIEIMSLHSLIDRSIASPNGVDLVIVFCFENTLRGNKRKKINMFF